MIWLEWAMVVLAFLSIAFAAAISLGLAEVRDEFRKKNGRYPSSQEIHLSIGYGKHKIRLY